MNPLKTAVLRYAVAAAADQSWIKNQLTPQELHILEQLEAELESSGLLENSEIMSTVLQEMNRDFSERSSEEATRNQPNNSLLFYSPIWMSFLKKSGDNKNSGSESVSAEDAMTIKWLQHNYKMPNRLIETLAKYSRRI